MQALDDGKFHGHMELSQSNIDFEACAVFWLALQSNLDKDPNRALNFKIGTFPSLTLIMTSELIALRDICHWVSVILSSNKSRSKPTCVTPPCSSSSVPLTSSFS